MKQGIVAYSWDEQVHGRGASWRDTPLLGGILLKNSQVVGPESLTCEDPCLLALGTDLQGRRATRARTMPAHCS